MKAHAAFASEPCREALELMAARFRALGEPLRLRLLQLLEGSEISVSELARTAGTSQPNVSKHLGVLQMVGLVQRRQEGSVALYSISDDSVFALCELVCSGVRERLTQQIGAISLNGFGRRR